MEKPILKNEIEARINGVATVEDNINDAKEYALQLKEYYSTLIFTDEQIKEAKDERASINKVVKKIADYRKNIVAEFKKPIELFELTAKETEKILKETADFVDAQVKNFENKEKEEKRSQCFEIYKNNIGEYEELITFEKIFNDKWLNKTTKLSEVENEIKILIEKLSSDMKAIKLLNSEFENELIATYLNHFSLSEAVSKNNELLEQKEKLEKVQEQKEEITNRKVVEMLTKEVKEDEIDPIKTYTLKITAPLSKQKALRQFLDLNNMTYERLDN
mgnify:CR=1 FL=1